MEREEAEKYLGKHCCVSIEDGKYDLMGQISEIESTGIIMGGVSYIPFMSIVSIEEAQEDGKMVRALIYAYVSCLACGEKLVPLKAGG